MAAVVTGAGGQMARFCVVLTLFVYRAARTFGSGARKVVAAVVTGRVAESVGGRRTLDPLRTLQQR